MFRKGSRYLKRQLDLQHEGKTNGEYLDQYFRNSKFSQGGFDGGAGRQKSHSHHQNHDKNLTQSASFGGDGGQGRSIYGSTPSIQRIALKKGTDLKNSFNKHCSL